MVVCDAVCAVRCVCVEGVPAPGHRQGAGDSDGCKGDPGGETQALITAPGWVAGWDQVGTEVPLGAAAAPPVLGSLCWQQPKMRRDQGSSGAQSPANLPQLPHHLQPELSCLSATSVLANTFPWAAFLTGPFPRGVLCQALPPPIPACPVAMPGCRPPSLLLCRWQGSPFPRQALVLLVWVRGARHTAAGSGCLMG